MGGSCLHCLLMMAVIGVVAGATSGTYRFLVYVGSATEFTSGQTVVFDIPYYEYGGGYNVTSGVYVCPASGTYRVYFGVTREDTSNDYTEMELMFGQRMLAASGFRLYGDLSAASALVDCVAGQKISVRVTPHLPYPATLQCCVLSYFTGFSLF